MFSLLPVIICRQQGHSTTTPRMVAVLNASVLSKKMGLRNRIPQRPHCMNDAFIGAMALAIITLFGLCRAKKLPLFGDLSNQLQPPLLLFGGPLPRMG